MASRVGVGVTVKDDLIKAAGIIEERGWCRLFLINGSGKCCALGAIGLATIPKYEDQPDRYSALGKSKRAEAAIGLLAEEITGKPHATFRTRPRVSAHNDHFAKNGQEMVDLLLSAANRLNGKG